MEGFYHDGVLLHGDTAKKLYQAVKELPIVDYHCHLDQKKIKSDAGFTDIGELWLAGDHYKWRAMRLCGVDEKYITGTASYREKFLKYAEILPQLIGNPLYAWTHMELKRIFGINEPLNSGSAERIYAQANEKLKTLTVRKLLELFRVEFIATTDDPADDLADHGVYGGTKVTPTFRPDRLYSLDGEYLKKLGKSAGIQIGTLNDLLTAIKKQLDFFVSRGCRMSDHGFERFPKRYAERAEAEQIFLKGKNATEEERDAYFGFLLVWLAKEYAKRKITMQLHFAVIRNNNREMYARCGADSGFDLIGEEQSVKDLVHFFDQIKDEERPQTVLYTLNDGNLPAIAAVTGAFRKVRMGAAWWFNDTSEGIIRNLSVTAEYSVLGTNLGMLTDSRSFSSYCRFDFFRRLVCDYIGQKTEEGEYDIRTAQTLAENLCYYNAKRMVENV